MAELLAGWPGASYVCVSVCVCGALLSSIEPLIFVHISLKQHQSVLS